MTETELSENKPGTCIWVLDEQESSWVTNCITGESFRVAIDIEEISGLRFSFCPCCGGEINKRRL